MATEKNPFEQKPEEVTNVIELNTPSEEISEQEISFEPSDDGGVIVDFSSESIEMAPEPEIEEWYGNLIDGLDEETLTEIAHDVRDKAINELFQHKRTYGAGDNSWFEDKDYKQLKLETNLVFHDSPKSDMIQFVYSYYIDPDYKWEPTKAIIWHKHNGTIGNVAEVL